MTDRGAADAVAVAPRSTIPPADIAILGPARFPVAAPFAGGMEMHTWTLADELTARGHDVTVYAAAGEGRFRTQRMLPVVCNADADMRRDVMGGLDVELSEQRSYRDAMLKLAVAHHDIVHVNAVHHLPFACSAMLSGAVSGTLHTPPDVWLAAAVHAAVGGVAPIRLASVSATNAQAWEPLVKGIRVIRNGVDLHTWRAGDGGGGAIWSGRLVAEKAPHLVIDAPRLAGVPLRLLGPIHDAAYFRRFVEPRLGGDVEYLGHVGLPELAAEVGAASVALVTPAWDEPFGLVVAEALACGTPVAGFARGALPELVDAATGVLVPADDVWGLALALHSAAALDRRECRARAEWLFSVDDMIDGYEAMFAELLVG